MLGFASYCLTLGSLPVYAVRYILAIVYTDALLTVPYAHLRMSNRAKSYAALKLLFAGASIAPWRTSRVGTAAP